jgi:amidase
MEVWRTSWHSWAMKSRRRVAEPARAAGAPFLHRIASLPEKVDPARYPFNIRAFAHGIDLAVRGKVTFFVGENGSGKSTLLEALAECCGFNPEGGNHLTLPQGQTGSWNGGDIRTGGGVIMHASDFRPAFATAADTAEAVRTKRISASELMDLTFQRIDRHNPKVNAIIWQNREQAMARAKQADEALARGHASGPLHGVPVTIKESFAYRGSPSCWGVPSLKDVISPRTAVAAERLESAGAILVGKTNVPVMLGDWQTYNPVYGTTNNPWDLTRTPGGSTGGGSAALAAGLGCLAIGSDLSGSIRIPAHFCGVYGHKPSLELISLEGFQPGPWDGSPGYPMDLSVAGPLARSARDLALALDVLGGANGDAARAWTWRMPAPRHKRLEDFRIGYVLDDGVCPVSSDIGTLYEKTLSELSKTGAQMERGWPSGVDPRGQMTTFSYLLFALLTADMNDEAREGSRKRFEHNPADIVAAAAVEPHARWLHETQRRLAFRALWQKYFESHDVFLLPTAFTAAFPHDHTEPIDKRSVDTPEGRRPYARDMASWIGPATLAGLPATVAPAGRTRAGLPAGIQIIAPMWEDGTSIEFAALLSDRVGGFTEPPAFQE